VDVEKFLNRCFEELGKKDASDLHVKSGEVPRIRFEKHLVSFMEERPDAAFLEELLKSLTTEYLRKRFETERSVDFAFTREPFGRFRVNVFSQKGELTMVFRRMRMKIPGFKELNLPPIFEKIAREERGLILISGPVGSGKTTTIASLIDFINHHRKVSIVTLEDPIEYLFRDDQALISQREVGIDIPSFDQALRYIVRQDPDVVVVGEIRDPETLRAALTAAETGRLVISTVHGKNVRQTFERILGLYPRETHEQILSELAYNLKALVSQRLICSMTAGTLAPACEILVANPSSTKMIRDGEFDHLIQILQNGTRDGMQTMNQALYQLYQDKFVSKEGALAASDNPQALEMNIKGIFTDEGQGGILGIRK